MIRDRAESDTVVVEEPGVTTIFKGGRPVALRLRKFKISVVAGPNAGVEVELGKSCIGGGRLNHINEIVLNDKAVSGAHFEIVSGDHGYQLVDLSSTNGTFVNGLRIKEVYLRPGTTFTVGNTELQFEPLQGMVEIALSDTNCFGHVLGASVKMREIFAELERVAPTDLTALLTGETGTGKELFARSIHAMSQRCDGPFVVLDCGAIPRDLIESTIFGHEKGAFTGAVGQQIGCFEQARGGTIFLDEIGELDINLQPKLLRVLESRELKRVGGAQVIKADIRIIAATNQNLKSLINKGLFREDLYFRLSVIHTECPALRDHKDDIPQLAEYFLCRVSEQRKRTMTLAPDAIEALTHYSWPGNVRELRNVIERVALLHRGETITRADIAMGRDIDRGRGVLVDNAVADRIRPSDTDLVGLDPSRFEPDVPFKDAKQEIVDDFEQQYLAALLERNNGNITRSAIEAGLTRFHLRELLKRHRLTPQQQYQQQDHPHGSVHH